MNICYSPRGVPYIFFDDGAIFIFSEETSTKTHYKYLVYSGLSDSTLTTTVSAGKGKGKQIKIIAREPVKFIVPVTLKGIPREAKKSIDEDDLEIITDSITPLLENGLFPKSKIKELEKVFSDLEAEE